MEFQLGAMSPQRADVNLGEPEDGIDYAAGASALLVADDVDEAESSPVFTGSPFGI